MTFTYLQEVEGRSMRKEHNLKEDCNSRLHHGPKSNGFMSVEQATSVLN